MKRIQTTKASSSILSYQKKQLVNSYQYGEIDEVFFKQLNEIIHKTEKQLESDSNAREPMQDIDFLTNSPFFNELPFHEIQALLDKKTDMLLQKDQLVIKSYEKHKYVYLVTKG